MQFDREIAIAMAVYSGNLLYRAADDAHAFALTLIVSNLFEMIGEGETSADRFADGFAKVARLANMDATVLGFVLPKRSGTGLIMGYDLIDLKK
ncbi:MAG: hypothetical protein OXG39_13120 [Chloroflexi bacterium]|nr:hypothetical protein [Chloroflexota bacterium]